MGSMSESSLALKQILHSLEENAEDTGASSLSYFQIPEDY